jgi:hypothetical protein
MKTKFILLGLLIAFGNIGCTLGQATSSPVSLFNGYALLGISQNKLKEIANSTLQSILGQYSDPGVEKDLQEINSGVIDWHYPLEPHITTKYWGSVMPTDPQDIQEYKSFQEGVTTIIRFPVVCYAVGGLIAMPAFMDQTQTPQSNRFAHTTVVSGSLSAQYSNDLLSALYDQEPEFAQNYNNGFTTPSQMIYKYTVTIKGQMFTSYVMQLPQVLWSTGSTRRFYIS